MNDLVVLAITMMTVGQITLSVSLLLVRAFKSATYFPLAVFLIANGVIALGPALSSLLSNWYTTYIAFVFPALFLLCPSLWLYVEGLTSNKPWHIQAKHARQYVLLGFGLMFLGVKYGASVSISKRSKGIMFTISCNTLPLLSSHIQPVKPI
mgnify:CR=1 FL=1